MFHFCAVFLILLRLQQNADDNFDIFSTPSKVLRLSGIDAVLVYSLWLKMEELVKFCVRSDGSFFGGLCFVLYTQSKAYRAVN